MECNNAFKFIQTETEQKKKYVNELKIFLHPDFFALPPLHSIEN